MATATKKCRYCKEHGRSDEMLKAPNNAWFCNVECMKSYAFKRVKAQNEKQARAKQREAKAKVKPKTKKLDELQALVNNLARLRDSGDGCISCDKTKDWHGQWHAGHYYSRGHSSALRFNLNNIHKQCAPCNNHLSGNIGQYTPKLIEKIGQARFDELTAKKGEVRRYSDEWIERAKRLVKIKIKRLECKL